MSQFCFYRERLSQNDKRVYDELANVMLQFRRSIDVARADDEDAVLEAIDLDNPMIFCVTGCSVQYRGRSLRVQPRYTVSSSQIDDCTNKVTSKARQIVGRVWRKDSVWQTLLNLHDELCQTTIYDLTKPHIHTALGVLATGYGVCDGIAKAFKLCCDEMSIDCICALGKAKRTVESDQYGPHCWNKVRIADKWYNLDATFDLSLSQKGALHHDFFLVTDDELAQTHRPTRHTIDCEFNGNYYGRKGFAFRNAEELGKLIYNNLDKAPLHLELKVVPDVDWKSLNEEIERAVAFAFNKAKRNGVFRLSTMEPTRTAYLIVE